LPVASRHPWRMGSCVNGLRGQRPVSYGQGSVFFQERNSMPCLTSR
jgi:hypothetical protein